MEVISSSSALVFRRLNPENRLHMSRWGREFYPDPGTKYHHNWDFVAGFFFSSPNSDYQLELNRYYNQIIRLCEISAGTRVSGCVRPLHESHYQVVHCRYRSQIIRFWKTCTGCSHLWRHTYWKDSLPFSACWSRGPGIHMYRPIDTWLVMMSYIVKILWETRRS